MNELYKAILELTFESFCGEIMRRGETTLEFKIKHCFHHNRREEFFVLQQTEDGLFVSDKGSALSYLDDTFILRSPDVIRNLAIIMNHFSIRKEGNAFRSSIDLSKKISPQIIRFLQGIHFMYTLKLFYQ